METTNTNNESKKQNEQIEKFYRVGISIRQLRNILRLAKEDSKQYYNGKINQKNIFFIDLKQVSKQEERERKMLITEKSYC